MAQFFILALGTRGDLEVFLTLARELRRRNHGVVLGTSGFFATRVREAGIETVPIGHGTWKEMDAVLRSLSSVRDPTERTMQYFRHWLQPQLSTGLARITGLAAQADYFISNLKIVLRRGREIIAGVAVTYDHPGAVEDLRTYRTQEHGGRILDLVALNRRLIDPDGRWGEAYRFTGFWSEPEWPTWSPPAELARFVEGGAPPVVITLGSMSLSDATQFVHDVAAALRRGGRRGVLVAGWSGIDPHAASSGPLRCEAEVPYHWLFPRASCVIHHGGYGTVAAVLQAGRASVVLPQITCQVHFARILEREGLATDVFDAQALDPTALTAAIDRAITDQQIRQAVFKWQRIISEDAGVSRAADLIEAHWQALTQH